MSKLGLIVGSGELPWPEAFTPIEAPSTQYGVASSLPETAQLGSVQLIKIKRHGEPHRFAPHAINYVGNIALFAALGVDGIVAINTVGGITADLQPRMLVLPDQLIDYTWGRKGTFSADDAVEHIDFTHPYDHALRARLLAAARSADIPLVDGGTMAVTQGPRLETAAEIRRLAADGCCVVGMTGMPEAALAREAGIAFASVALVVNPAAGVGPAASAADGIDMAELRSVSDAGMAEVARLLRVFCEAGVQSQQ